MNGQDEWRRLLKTAARERAEQPGRICDLCVSMLAVSGAGIGVVTKESNRGVVCATDDISRQIEELQFSLNEGPCVQAATEGAPVLIPDLLKPDGVHVERWPAFMHEARAAGVRAVFALPLRIGVITVGVLDLYRRQPGDLSSNELRLALLAADAAALALLHLDTQHGDSVGDDFDVRSTYQLQVHQATGMVQVQMQTTTEEALLRLRARAFALGRPLVEVANSVVSRRLRFTVEDV